MINGTYGSIISDPASGPFNNPIGSELTQSRANIVGRSPKPLGDFSCRKPTGGALQNFENAVGENWQHTLS
jgi:hypothetical protein